MFADNGMTSDVRQAPVPRSFRSEAFSFFTHLAGALVAILALVLLVLRADGPLEVVAYSIYGGTLILMFASSALHHVAHSEDGFFRRLDMTAVYLLIVGTYTPVCLLALPAAWGIPLLVVVGILAGVGIVVRWTVPSPPRWVTVGLYLGLGWMAVIALVPLARVVEWAGLGLLFGGGVAYSLGAVIYAKQWPDPWPRVVGHHGVWHVFVLVAAGLHFLLVWNVGG